MTKKHYICEYECGGIPLLYKLNGSVFNELETQTSTNDHEIRIPISHDFASAPQSACGRGAETRQGYRPVFPTMLH